MPTMDDWTEAEFRLANGEGWDLFECHGSDNGPWQLQKIDDPDEYEAGNPGVRVTARWHSDDDVWRYVWERAQAGDEPHGKALAILAEVNPRERRAIEAWCAGPMSDECGGGECGDCAGPCDHSCHYAPPCGVCGLADAAPDSDVCADCARNAARLLRSLPQ